MLVCWRVAWLSRSSDEVLFMWLVGYFAGFVLSGAKRRSRQVRWNALIRNISMKDRLEDDPATIED